jgi:Asp-tRNA(Asn)/Glu-tRNA(Gln) amidotransferase A subunit family amidase
MDEVGPMARTITDLAIVLDATAGKDPADPTTVPLTTSFVDAVDGHGLEGRRIGILRQDTDGVPFDYDAELDGTLRRAFDEMADGGATFVDVTLPTYKGPFDEFFYELGPAMKGYLASEPTAPAGALSQLVAPGDRVQSLDTPAHRRALAARETMRIKIESFMDERDLDAIAYPVSPTTARPIGVPGESNTENFDCGAAPIVGLPSLAVPVGFASDGLPVGLQLMGRAFDETTLIAIAAGYEAHTDHRGLPASAPPLPTEG